MKTKFDINENVLIQGRIKSIAVNEKEETGYKVIFTSVDGPHVLVFDENKIVREYSKCNAINTTPPELRTCGRCKYDSESISNTLSPCYMCCRNPQDNRPEYWEEDNN